MVAFQKFYAFTEDLVKAAHNFQSNTLKCALSAGAPVNTNTVLANITQIAATGGYTTGGANAGGTGVTSAVQTTGTLKLIMPDITFTATAGGMPGFRYVTLYNDTHASDAVIGFWDYGSTVNLADTETFTVDFDPSTGVLTIA